MTNYQKNTIVDVVAQAVGCILVIAVVCFVTGWIKTNFSKPEDIAEAVAMGITTKQYEEIKKLVEFERRLNGFTAMSNMPR